MEFDGRVYQTVGIPMGIIFLPLLAHFFLNSYEAHFVQHLQKKVCPRNKQKTSFNLTFCYAILSLNKPYFNDCIDVIHVYPAELEIKDTTNAPK